MTTSEDKITRILSTIRSECDKKMFRCLLEYQLSTRDNYYDYITMTFIQKDELYQQFMNKFDEILNESDANINSIIVDFNGRLCNGVKYVYYNKKVIYPLKFAFVYCRLEFAKYLVEKRGAWIRYPDFIFECGSVCHVNAIEDGKFIADRKIANESFDECDKIMEIIEYLEEYEKYRNSLVGKRVNILQDDEDDQDDDDNLSII